MIPRKGASLELSSPRWKKKTPVNAKFKKLYIYIHIYIYIYIYKTIDVILRASCLLSLCGRGKTGPVKNRSL